MAKTYLETVKYNIIADFEIKGIVDKPDIIGAVFGQSEGLLGEDLDLRELQKNGRIGRIEIDLKIDSGKTKGVLNIPSSMDMVETSILAAAVESVDKVGPFESKFSTKKIEDTRNIKRKEIESRAKDLLKKFMTEQIPDSQEFTEKIREETRSADIEEFGPEKIPAGPDIRRSDEIIVVEGRADVLNLLRNGIKNAIAMGGAKPPETLLKLCMGKTVVLFVDGDRGGELNVRKMASMTKVDFVVKAPEGKEVEELARKEIIMALRKREKAEDFMKEHSNGFAERNSFQRMQRLPAAGFERTGRGMRQGFGRPRGRMERPSRFGRDSGNEGFQPRFGARHSFRDRGNFAERPQAGGFEGFAPQEAAEAFSQPRQEMPKPEQKATQEEEAAFKPVMQELKGSLKARFLDSANKTVKEVEVREMLNELKGSKNVNSIVFDGIITKRVVDEAKKIGVKAIVGVKKGKIENESEVKLLAMAV